MEILVGIIVLLLSLVATSIICILNAHKDEIWGRERRK